MHWLTAAKQQDDPLWKWKDERDLYLRELLRLDGRADLRDSPCTLCNIAGGPEYRCEDCFGGELFCKGCMVNIHACMPLHRVEVRGRDHPSYPYRLSLPLIALEWGIF